MNTTDERPRQLAAPAPASSEECDEDVTTEPIDSELHALCERWAHWCETRRFYGPNSAPVSLLGKLREKGSGRSTSGGPDAVASAELAAFHLAVLAQPEGKAKVVFQLHYLHRVRNIKQAAAALGIGRQRWYTLLRDFRRQAHAASQSIAGMALAEAQMRVTGWCLSSAKMSPLDATKNLFHRCDTSPQNSTRFR